PTASKIPSRCCRKCERAALKQAGRCRLVEVGWSVCSRPRRTIDPANPCGRADGDVESAGSRRSSGSALVERCTARHLRRALNDETADPQPTSLKRQRTHRKVHDSTSAPRLERRNGEPPTNVAQAAAHSSNGARLDICAAP